MRKPILRIGFLWSLVWFKRVGLAQRTALWTELQLNYGLKDRNQSSQI